MVDVAEGAGPVDRLHHLLLAMTGRVDDDAVNSARELLGVGQLDAAAELLAGCLLAGRIPVTSSEQYHLRRVLDEARSLPSLADRLHVVQSLFDEGHRFSDQNRPESDIAEALQPITPRLAGVRGLWCVWRVTPAGVTYGAVPRRVLLAEVGPDGSVSATGYQILEALRRAGIGCSVDVFTTGTELPEYHRDALAVARRVHLDTPAVTSGQNHARAPRATSGGEPAGKAGGSDLPSEPPPPALPPPEPEREVEQTSVMAPVVDAPAPSREPEVFAETASKAEKPADEPENSGMRVPAAVDAKLTDRERNLLRKLHEELAQREQDRGGKETSGARGGKQEAWTSTAPGSGTGGFPSISNSTPNQAS